MKRLVLACLGITTALAGSPAAFQSPSAVPSPSPSFEVASVKPSHPNPSSPFGSIPMIMPPVGGRFSATNVPLRLLIRVAYELQDFQIVGGPSWQMSDKFDIVAKAEDGTARTMQAVLPLVKALLADRFKLKVHTETRELPIYALVIAREDKKLGPDIKPSTSDCSNAQAENQKRAEALAKGGPAALASVLPRPGETMTCSIGPGAMRAGAFGMRANGQAISILTQLLTQVTGRIVQDQTGLTGLYDWEMTFDPEILMRLASQAGVNLPAGINLPTSDSPSMLTALREQLGLKLDSRRGPVEVLVIDGAELPTPN